MVSSGGVGAVRRARSVGGRVRALGLAAALGLVASGSTPAVPASPSVGAGLLAGLPLEGAPESPAGVLSAGGEEVPAADDPASGAVEAVAPGAPVPATALVTSTSTAAADRPIVAPAEFPRVRESAPRSAKRTSHASGPKDGGVWAVVVGIDDYPGEDADLKAAVADARDVDSALAAYGVPADRRVMLLDRQATAENIRDALAWMAGRASTEATAVFFYSGHVRRVPGDPDRDGEAVDEAIVSADGDNVYDGEVAGLLRSMDARSAWIGIAGCYGAGFDDAVVPGRILTAAAAEGDLAYENSGLGHSYMAEYMVRRAMLQGKAPTSVQDAFAWARTQIARDYPNRQPVVIDHSRGPVVLGRDMTPPPAPERKAPPSEPPAESKEPQPGPSAPPPTAPKPEGPACTDVLGVSVCSEERSRGTYPRGAPARPAESGGD